MCRFFFFSCFHIRVCGVSVRVCVYACVCVCVCVCVCCKLARPAPLS